MHVAESFIRLIALTSSCLRMVEAELGRVEAGGAGPGIVDALERVQRLRPSVELIALTGAPRQEDEGGSDD